MQKTFLICSLYLLAASCKTFYFKGNTLIQTPPLKARLIESANYKATALSYKVNNIKVADAVNIETWVISVQNPENCFFFFVPNVTTLAQCGDFMERLAIKTNSKVIGVQYRGYNYSDGSPQFEQCFKDNEIVYQYYKAEIQNAKTVNLAGVSLGTVFIPKLASQHKSEFDNIILMSTFSTPKSLLKHNKKMLPVYLKPFIKIKTDTTFYSLDNVETLKDYQNGLLVIQAKDDKTTAYTFALEIMEKAVTKRKELMTLEDGDHFALFSEKYINSVIEKISAFIKK
jgi:esterase/lipase